MRGTMTYNADKLCEDACNGVPQVGLPDGRWVMARPLGLTGIRYRLRLAWDVFTGKADALYWTEQ